MIVGIGERRRDPATARCPRCGGETRVLPEPPGSTHHARLVCRDCGGFLKWVGKSIDADEAAAFPMPFGRYRGTPLGELDSGYLAWVAANVLQDRIRERARLVLAARAEGRRR